MNQDSGVAAPLVDITMESLDGSNPGNRTSMPRHYYTPALERATPWWVWFVGGAAAVGLGIGGATWYVRSTAPAPPALALAPEPSTPPTLIPLRLRSEPSDVDSVRKGGATELCRTPCLLNIDPTEYGNVTVRPFVLRRQGAQDTTVIVDLRGAQRDFLVTLPLLPVPTPSPDPAALASEPSPAPPTTPVAAPSPAAAALHPAPRRGNPSAASGAKPLAPAPPPAASSVAGKPPAKATTSPVPSRDDAAVEPFVLPEPPPAPSAPTAPNHEPAEKPGKIDRSETIDPFRTKP